jgi:hypothetical protein
VPSPISGTKGAMVAMPASRVNSTSWGPNTTLGRSRVAPGKPPTIASSAATFDLM